MQAFKLLWQPKGNISIPHYDVTDGVDLQVKALLYMYKRFGIAKATDKLELQLIQGITVDDMRSLDKLYNIQGFMDVFRNDPHRVLIDWVKNRFRAMSILAHFPQMEQLPEFSERNFKFMVLEADASKDEYIRTLSQSDIYIEHNLPIEIRREIAASVIHRLNPTTLEARHKTIIEYLHLVGTEIQVARIYKAMVSKVSPQHSPQHSPLHTPLTSPQRSPQRSPQLSPQRSSSPQRSPQLSPQRSQSPQRSPQLSPQQSPLRSRFPRVAQPPKLSASPPKLNASPPQQPQKLRIRSSQSNLKLGSAPNLNQNSVIPSIDAGKKVILQQARLAVKARIEKEKKAIMGTELLRG